ncbi:MAG: hypothetical protein Q9227_006263 [Pyrenula ochraceoflavens]
MASSQPEDGGSSADHHEPASSDVVEEQQPHPDQQVRPTDKIPNLLPSADIKKDSKTASRDTSPSRTNARTSQPSVQNSRSRKNSQDLSPNRSISTQLASTPSVPSAAAIQRALSATNNKMQQPSPNIDGVSEGKGDPAHAARSSEPSPQWPKSPRLTSPPPKPSSRIPQSVNRKSESEVVAPNTSLKRMAATAPILQVHESSVEDLKELSRQSQTAKSPAGELTTSRPVLPTVIEGNQQTGIPSVPPTKPATDEQKLPNGTSKPEGSDSGNESGGKRPASLKTSASDLRVNNLAPSRPSPVMPKRSLTSLNLAKSKTLAEPPLRSMTVETETVSSVPQVSLGVGGGERGPSGRSDGGGSLRTKPSVETIRPKKDKKRTARKQPSINAGTASSKADIFEAKVASAVDEANSSDSDETFVYESNPPDAQNIRAYRHHSRTPSATSMASTKDLYPSRYSRPSAKEGNHSVAGKRSMKFTNTHHNSLEVDANGHGSIRADGRSGQATPRHHHFGRHGRGGHASLFENDSPFTQNKVPSPKTPYANGSSRSRPNSPRVAGYRVTTGARKSEGFAFDNDEEAADDERAPLIGSVRITRSRHGRRPNSSSLRQMEYQGRRRGCMARYGSYLLLSLLLFIVIFLGTMFVVGLTKPLVDVHVRHIQNVLASEQEIMLDLDVRATNPNLFAITVADMDVNVFAKSGYVRSASQWRDEQTTHEKIRKSRVAIKKPESGLTKIPLISGSLGGIDEGTDPIEDPEGDAQTMLLGRIYEFDSPLNFDPSPLRRQPSHSVGEVRLQKPGNKTEEGGSARWERVIQHPFELIVRGVFKYQLPLSSKFKTASVSSRTRVLPEDDEHDDKSHKNLTSVSKIQWPRDF